MRGLLMALGLLGLAMALLLVVPDPTSALIEGPLGGPYGVVVLAVAFVLTERYVFQVEYRQDGSRYSMAEIASAVAVIFMSPILAATARTAASLVGVLLRARRGRINLVKLLFNTALFILEPTLAATVVRYGAELLGSRSPAVYVALAAPAILLASMAGTVAVVLVVSLHEGGFRERLHSEVPVGVQVNGLGAVLGATAVAPAILHPLLILLPILPVVTIWRLLLSHGDLGQRHRDLSALHAFTRTVSYSLDLSAVVTSAQEETRRLLRARYCGLVVFDPETGDRRMSSASDDGGALPGSVRDPAWQKVLRGQDAVVRLTGDDAAQLSFGEGGWSEVLAAPIRDSEGLVGLLVVADREGLLSRFSNDDLTRLEPLVDQLSVTLRKGLLHIRVEHEATHDRLTGLPNRALFERLVTSALASPGSVSVFLMDLDRFKEVNDGLGHHVGDLLLQQFALRMESVLGLGVILSRLAGDEFAVLAVGLPRAKAIELGTRVLGEAREPFDLGELSVAVSCSIGLAVGPGHGEDAITLLRRADLAMYEAKGRSGGLAVYREDLETSSAQRLRLLQDLRTATVTDQMEAYFQPKIDLGSGIVMGAEALVRWRHPERGVLEADSFVTLAEQTDLIHVLTDHMLTSALQAARAWRARGWYLGVAVNMSARSLLDELLADRVARHLHNHDVPPQLLTIEITETSFMADVSRALLTLNRLHDLGVQLSVDDYGTGYSSLTYLRRLPVSELKVDRGFIANVLTDQHDQVIVRSTIDLGRHLGLRVVAEGIENDEVAARLRDLGCDQGQGIGIAPPMPLGEFDSWVEAGPYSVRELGGHGERVTA